MTSRDNVELITVQLTSCPSFTRQLGTWYLLKFINLPFNKCSVNTVLSTYYIAMSMTPAVSTSVGGFLVQLFSLVMCTNLGIIATYRCQGHIIITDLYHHVSKIEFPYFILMVILLNLIVLYIFIFIWFYLGKITSSIPKLKGKWYGQIWADFLPLPWFVIMGTEMGSGEGCMMGDFFFKSPTILDDFSIRVR